MYSYLLSPHLTWCYGLLWIILFKLNVFWPYHFSFIVCPSVLDDLPPLVVVASFSYLLRVFNDIVRVSKIAAYLLWGKVYMDFSSSNVDNCFNGAEERLPRMMGGSYSSSPMSKTWKSVYTKWSSILRGILWGYKTLYPYRKTWARRLGQLRDKFEAWSDCSEFRARKQDVEIKQDSSRLE